MCSEWFVMEGRAWLPAEVVKKTLQRDRKLGERRTITRPVKAVEDCEDTWDSMLCRVGTVIRTHFKPGPVWMLVLA